MTKFIKYFLSIVGLAIIYHLAARLGLLMANVQPNTSPVWPPTGIAIAALLLFGKKYWPGVTLGVIFGYLFNNNALNVTIGLAIGNTLEAIVAVSLLKKFADFHNSLDRIQDVIGLAFFGAIATSISASIGVLTLLIVGVDIELFMWTVWFTWWIGDFLGLLVITPLLLIWFTHWPLNWKSKTFLEGVIVIVLLLIVTSYVFTNQQIGQVAHEAMIYLIFPFVIYAALRFTQLGAVNSVALVSGIAIYGTVIGSGPLVRATINESLILLQTFMGVVALIALTLSATTNQRKKAEEALQHRIEDLAKLNDSSQTFLGIFETEKMYAAVCRIVVDKFNVNAAWIELDKSDDKESIFITPYGIDRNKIINFKDQLDHPENHPISNRKKIENIKSTNKTSEKLLYLPLHFGGKTLGQLVLLSDENDFFDDDKKILLESYANLAAVAIQNTWLLDQVKGGNERLHALSHRLMEVQESERLHLSRELHDESGQIISAIMVQLGLLERDANNPTLILQYVQELKQIASDLLNNLHDMAVRLRPASLDHLGLVTAIDQYISDFGRQHNIDIQFDTVGLSGKRHPLDTETAIFRVIQESLTNVILHASASRVDVLLSQRKNMLNLLIEDNGIGFIPESVAEHTRLGLFGMRERVEMLGGKFTIESGLGKGTTIQVEVPNGN
ncbi:MAG: MASE1 domain-containing protein [Anaerolineaceae bacterium]|nr:MASE1 domain-containing protein [Anaerolineaceae bacterium]